MGFFILMSSFSAFVFLDFFFWQGRFFARSLVDGLTAWRLHFLRLHFFYSPRVNLHIFFCLFIYNCVDTGGRSEGRQD